MELVVRCLFHKMVKVETLKPHPKNRNTHSDDQIERLSMLLKYQGVRAPIVVSSRSGYIVKGHGTLLAIKAAGSKSAPVVHQDFDSDEQEYAFLQSDNAIAAWSELDVDSIKDDIGAFDSKFDVDMLGLENFEIEKKTSGDGKGTDDVPEPPTIPKTKKGDLYQLGAHRLLCGDSCNPDDVGILMGGNQADLIFTDPPWNVNYGVGMEEVKFKPRTIMNDHMTPENWDAFVSGFCKSLSKPGCPIYLVMSAQEWPSIDKNLRLVGFHWSSTIIWAKDRLVLSRKDYHTQYEPIWYGWNEDAARMRPLDDRTQTDLWNFNRPSVSDLHPTTKPVELIVRAIQNSSKPKNLVVDLFGGSGSTLIASEVTSRQCNVMELDPQYADVIVSRYCDYTSNYNIQLNGKHIDWSGQKNE